jgi:hypothetical protein
MAWVTRNGYRYYYRTQRIDGKVKRIYCGTGEAAAKAAAEDEAIRQAKREAKLHEQQAAEILAQIRQTLRRLS